MSFGCYYICAHFSKISFAHSFHLRTEIYIICAQFYCYICAHVLCLFLWPAAGILINQGTTNKVSLLALFTGLGVKSFSSLSPGLFFHVVMFESIPRRIIVSFSWVCKFPLCTTTSVLSYFLFFLNLKPSYKIPRFPRFVLKCSIWLVNTDPRAQTYHLPEKIDVRKCNIYLVKLCAQMKTITWGNCVRK